MKSCLLSGGTGFIGSVFRDCLLRNNISVTLLVRDYNHVPKHIFKQARVIEYDPLCASELDISSDYDCFYNLGWSGVGPDQKNDLDLQLGNIKCAVEALKLSKKVGCKKFISAGTVAEYVFCETVMNLDEKQSPNDFYGAAKTATHYFLDVASRQMDVPFNWVVIPSTYGEGRVGKNIITYTIESLLNGETPKYGTLHQMWDFLYVEDVAAALLRIGEYGITGKTYGIGSGIYKPLRWYIEKIRDIVSPGANLGIGELPSMSSKSFSSCVNIHDLQNDTGFFPQHSFEEGITRTVEWYRQRINR